MSLLADLSVLLERAPGFSKAIEALRVGDDFTLAAPPSIRPLLVAATFRANPRATLVVVPGADAADRFARQLTAYLPLDLVLPLPGSANLPWSRQPGDIRVTGRRARALYALQENRPAVVVASAAGLLRLLPPRGASEVFAPFVLECGTFDLDEAMDLLPKMGYERVGAAEEPGQFAVRGGTIDIFPSDGHFPVRAELDGDEIESVRRSVPSTGQSVGDVARVEAYPCREIRLSNRTAKDVAHPYRSGFRDLQRRSLGEPIVAHELELLEQGVYFDGVEAYLPYVYRELASVTDYLAKDALVTVAEPRAVFDDTLNTYKEFGEAGDATGQDVGAYFVQPSKLDLGGHQRLTLLSTMHTGAAHDADLVARRPDVAGGETKTVQGLSALVTSGHTVLLLARDRRQRETLAANLADAGLPIALYGGVSHVVPGSDRDIAGGLVRGAVNVGIADIPAGFVVPDAWLAVVSVDDAYPRNVRRSQASVDPTSLTFDFKPGDYVVHATHGIALFREITRREVLGAERDYLLLEYAKGDRLYVPVEQLERVTKYVGPDQSAPRVTRLNTADWSRATGKARAAAKKLAFDLVDLYARRSAATGYAFGPDTNWQHEMEAAFPYIETPDQLSAIADVKADMESDKPMDRLVCGDVGYGKTEVAIRAAFKATQDGKQVMVLCPTTILTQQHFTTFSDRFAAFPVHVEVLSRFRTKAQQETALKGFNEGTVDILIGTHRLLSRDVVPKDLGLVIVDEEQRFGVEHKEHLKNLREQVDVLTLSATPIPRTLQMALGGVRDMSVIDTPPPNRFPVQVHVGEFDADAVQGAIRRELARGGQVYYIFNRVMTIEQASERVRELVPEATIGVAHGQMSEHQLERAMEGFAAGQIDVLVATTIIESGIDNPHTNTLIIEDSERLGLAQLYQLKGRVGRSHVKAYAYFLFSRGKQLSEQAAERLTAIAELTELGSGIKVAMRDLEIRGAGSLLGAEQHGNMSAVGFDLYAQMLREAVSEARGEPEAALPDVRVDVPVKAFLPEEYVEAADERVRYYRRFAAALTTDGVEGIVSDIVTKHGPMPEVASNLAGVSRARVLAGTLGITNVAVVRNRVVMQPVSLDDAQRGKLAAFGAVYVEKDRKLQLPLVYGEPVMNGVLGALAAILSNTVES